MHPHRKLEYVVHTFALRLRLGNVIAPHVSVHVTVSTQPSRIHFVTYMPCLRTRTAYVSGYASIAASNAPVKSSSNAVFSIMGTRRVSWNPNRPALPLPFGMPLICSILLISKHASLPCSFSTRSVISTHHWECVCMQQPAPRSKAARKRGVQSEGLRLGGFRRYTRWLAGYLGVSAERTNISLGFMSSFWTPEGAMKICCEALIETPPPVPVTCAFNQI